MKRWIIQETEVCVHGQLMSVQHVMGVRLCVRINVCV